MIFLDIPNAYLALQKLQSTSQEVSHDDRDTKSHYIYCKINCTQEVNYFLCNRVDPHIASAAFKLNILCNNIKTNGTKQCVWMWISYLFVTTMWSNIQVYLIKLDLILADWVRCCTATREFFHFRKLPQVNKSQLLYQQTKQVLNNTIRAFYNVESEEPFSGQVLHCLLFQTHNPTIHYNKTFLLWTKVWTFWVFSGFIS